MASNLERWDIDLTNLGLGVTIDAHSTHSKTPKPLFSREYDLLQFYWCQVIEEEIFPEVGLWNFKALKFQAVKLHETSWNFTTLFLEVLKFHQNPIKFQYLP